MARELFPGVSNNIVCRCRRRASQEGITAPEPVPTPKNRPQPCQRPGEEHQAENGQEFCHRNPGVEPPSLQTANAGSTPFRFCGCPFSLSSFLVKFRGCQPTGVLRIPSLHPDSLTPCSRYLSSCLRVVQILACHHPSHQQIRPPSQAKSIRSAFGRIRQ